MYFNLHLNMPLLTKIHPSPQTLTSNNQTASLSAEGEELASFDFPAPITPLMYLPMRIISCLRQKLCLHSMGTRVNSQLITMMNFHRKQR